jgi:Tfp pilus assembly protein PilX
MKRISQQQEGFVLMIVVLALLVIAVIALVFKRVQLASL